MWFLKLVWIAMQTHWRGSTGYRAGYRSDRRQTRLYKKKREQVKCLWIVAGLVVLMEPVLHFAVGVSLFTTFLSFMYLDEAGESGDGEH